MLLQDVINLARYSEIAGTAIKDNDEAIILFINSGMLELYKRFPLMTNEHIVNLSEGVTLYDLPADYMYALSAWGEVEEPNAIEGEVQELPINDSDNPKSVFFPNHKQIQIPFVSTLVSSSSYISLIYVAKPPQYTINDVGEDIDISDTLIDCILHYVGYKAHLGIRSDGQSENNSHFMRFERSCEKARELGVAYPIDSWRMVDRLGTRGFV